MIAVFSIIGGKDFLFFLKKIIIDPLFFKKK